MPVLGVVHGVARKHGYESLKSTLLGTEKEIYLFSLCFKHREKEMGVHAPGLIFPLCFLLLIGSRLCISEAL